MSEFLSFSQELPLNIAEGVLLPFQLKSAITSEARTLVITVAPRFSSGEMETGNLGVRGWNWSEAPEPLTNSIYATAASLPNRFFRWRHPDATSTTLFATLRHSEGKTNLTAAFEMLPGWNIALQERVQASWRDISGPAHGGGNF